MSQDARSTAILVPGKLHPHVIDRLSHEFELVRIDRSDKALITPELAAKVQGIASATLISAEFIDALPKLEIIAHFGVGYDPVDAGHAASKNICVTHTPDVLSDEVADTAIGLLLNTLRELPQAEAYLRAGRWEKEGPYRLTAGSLRGRRVGIYGMGRIGLAVARRLEGFGVEISYHNRRQVPGVAYLYHPTLLDMARAVDTLICVVPSTPETEKTVGTEIFTALGPQGVFVNVGRGATVDETALIEALKTRTILAAGLDVFTNEPHVPEELLALENASLLPHVASASVKTRTMMADLVVDNLLNWFTAGQAITAVPEARDIGRRR
ncbi:2-hydroxyacid dehydrogenase [Limoniibacter endophyticus]|uniref:Dihydrofolate reductase n=1 Tax=Limoniibacter endophyticus TaxID=1565040 RepID=A0A8J3DM59_9HYPH|nr:2-hydroxyacid dehydrogenase [Limoniibacter endophyticus]GHC63909.1 dihydrofolate reductase [Limoniibacter endophyticus]